MNMKQIAAAALALTLKLRSLCCFAPPAIIMALAISLTGCANRLKADAAPDYKGKLTPIQQIGITGGGTNAAITAFQAAGYQVIDFGSVTNAREQAKSEGIQFIASIDSVGTDGSWWDGFFDFSMRVTETQSQQIVWSATGEFGQAGLFIDQTKSTEEAMRAMVANFAKVFPPVPKSSTSDKEVENALPPPRQSKPPPPNSQREMSSAESLANKTSPTRPVVAEVDEIEFHYTVTLPDGTVCFDSRSHQGGTPKRRAVRRLDPTALITKVVGMHEGETRDLTVQPKDNRLGRTGNKTFGIPPNSTLTYTITVVRIIPAN